VHERFEEDLAYAMRHRTELALLSIQIDKYKILFLRRGKQFAEDIFKAPGSAGPVFLCHPKLFFEKLTDYHEATLTSAANAALNDDCLSSPISLVDNILTTGEITIFKNELVLFIDSDENVTITLISLNGQVVNSSKHNLSSGINRIIMDGKNIAKGMYVLDIKGDSQLHYRNKVTLK